MIHGTLSLVELGLAECVYGVPHKRSKNKEADSSSPDHASHTQNVNSQALRPRELRRVPNRPLRKRFVYDGDGRNAACLGCPVTQRTAKPCFSN